MSDHWVGKQVTGDETILVYDPSVQLSDTNVYLFDSCAGRMGELERTQARNTIRKAVNPLEIQSAISAYHKWIDTEAGRQFIRLVQRIQNGPAIPHSLHKFYHMGYRDGSAGYLERDFNERTPEMCRREYNRGYIDGIDDFTVEQELNFVSLPDEVDEWYFLDSNPDTETVEDDQRQAIEEERIYQSRLKHDRAKWPKDKYDQYLKSDHWLLTKIAALIRANFQCQSCGRPEHLEIHHKTYAQRGAEAQEDVIVLCRRCHENRHGSQH